MKSSSVSFAWCCALGMSVLGAGPSSAQGAAPPKRPASKPKPAAPLKKATQVPPWVPRVVELPQGAQVTEGTLRREPGLERFEVTIAVAPERVVAFYQGQFAAAGLTVRQGGQLPSGLWLTGFPDGLYPYVTVDVRAGVPPGAETTVFEVRVHTHDEQDAPPGVTPPDWPADLPGPRPPDATLVRVHRQPTGQAVLFYVTRRPFSEVVGWIDAQHPGLHSRPLPPQEADRHTPAPFTSQSVDFETRELASSVPRLHFHVTSRRDFVAVTLHYGAGAGPRSRWVCEERTSISVDEMLSMGFAASGTREKRVVDVRPNGVVAIDGVSATGVYRPTKNGLDLELPVSSRKRWQLTGNPFSLSGFAVQPGSKKGEVRCEWHAAP